MARRIFGSSAESVGKNGFCMRLRTNYQGFGQPRRHRPVRKALGESIRSRYRARHRGLGGPMGPAASRQHSARGGVPPPGSTALPGGPRRKRSILRRRAVTMRLLGQPLCRTHRRMRLKSILNHVEPHRCFVYKQVRKTRGRMGSRPSRPLGHRRHRRR